MTMMMMMFFCVCNIRYNVAVTNTGKVDSDDVVLGFMVPPGAGTGGVPLQVCCVIVVLFFVIVTTSIGSQH